MKEIIFDLLSVGKPAKAFSLNPEVKREDTHTQLCVHILTQITHCAPLAMFQRKAFQFFVFFYLFETFSQAEKVKTSDNTPPEQINSSKLFKIHLSLFICGSGLLDMSFRLVAQM